MKRHGFTLLEVLVALAVVAVALVALVRASAWSVDALAGERERTLATWVAANVITDVRLAEALPAAGRSEGSMIMGERNWFWRLEVQSTEDPAIRRLEVQVYDDPALTRSVAVLTGFAGLP